MGYRVEGGRLYYRHYPVRGADVATFDDLGHDWGRDAGSVFFVSRRKPRIDRDSFQVLNAVYARDRAQAYGGGIEIEGADAASFAVFGTGEWEEDWGPQHHRYFKQGYAADARSVWHHVKTIGKPSRMKMVDRASFTRLKWGYARDRQRAYYERGALKGCDVSSFIQLTQFFSRDLARAFFLTAPIPGVDVHTFAPLRGFTARDARRVYRRAQAVDGADPATYEVLGDSDIVGKDASHVFVHGEVLPDVDHATFASLGGAWYRDAGSVYHWGDRIDAIDAASFRVTAGDVGEDKTGRWRGASKLKE